jgi:hypothetical protein
LQAAPGVFLTLLSRHVRVFTERPALDFVGVDRIDRRPERRLLIRPFLAGGEPISRRDLYDLFRCTYGLSFSFNALSWLITPLNSSPSA